MIIDVKFRNATPEDKNFILSSWLKGLRQKRNSELINPVNQRTISIEQGNSLASMPHDLFFDRVRPIVEKQIYPKSEITVAHNPEFEDQIYGYIIYRKIGAVSIISFCYVKQPFRKIGIAKQLFETAKSETNVSTYHAPWLTKTFKKEGINYDPFFDYFTKE